MQFNLNKIMGALMGTDKRKQARIERQKLKAVRRAQFHKQQPKPVIKPKREKRQAVYLSFLDAADDVVANAADDDQPLPELTEYIVEDDNGN